MAQGRASGSRGSRDLQLETTSLDPAPGVASGWPPPSPETPENALNAGWLAEQRREQAPPPKRDAVFRRLLALADVAAGLGAAALMMAIATHHVDGTGLLTVPLIVLIAKVIGLYDHDELVLRKSTLDEVPRLVSLAAAFALLWSASTFTLGLPHPMHGTGTVGLWIVTTALLILARAGARRLGQLSAPPERVLIAGDARSRTRLAHSLRCDPGAHVEIVGFLPVEDERREQAEWNGRSRRRRQLTVDDMSWLVHELSVDRVFLISSGTDTETMLDIVGRTTALGVKVSIVPRLLEVVGSAVEFDTVGGVTVLGVRRPGLTRSSKAVKRAMDVAGAGLGLLVTSPVVLAIAIAIKLDSEGPVFFRQRRVGREGEVFWMLKFRSMVDGAESHRHVLEELNESEGTFKLSYDPRVTRVGRILRRTSLDELPQLFNVLRGDMSLVGPRPLVLDEDRLVEGRHRDRLQLAPGMTGPWQVLGPARPPLSEMVKTDYLYAANWSLWSDVKILLRTLAHVGGMRGV